MSTLERPDRDLAWHWHVAINEFAVGKAGLPDYPQFMYLAKSTADEVPRLAMLFEMERNGKLPKHHYQWSHDHEGQPVPDNHLACCLGVECRKCPFLAALDTAKVTPEEIDQMKAWTCIAHILQETGKRDFLDTSEGFILTTDDRMYWDNILSSLAGADDDGILDGTDTE